MKRDINLKELNNQFEKSSPPEILKWAWQTFQPEVGITSSFQTQSLPLLHMIANTVPEMPVFFLDTGFHFPETLIYRDRVRKELNLNLVNLTPKLEPGDFQIEHDNLYRKNPDLCCFLHKVTPLQEALKGLKAWVSGIRHDQTPQRRNTPFISKLENGLYKICPMISWTKRDVWQYISRHNLPEHPLLSQGYLSIGCAPCTRPVQMGENERAGRWPGAHKIECGLHTDAWENPPLAVSETESKI